MGSKTEIQFEDFMKVDIRIGEIREAVVPEGSNTLMRLTVYFGDEVGERTIFSGIKEWFAPEDLVGIKTSFIINLPFKKMGNFGVSEGMLFAASDDTDEKKPVLLLPQEDVAAGTPLI